MAAPLLARPATRRTQGLINVLFGLGILPLAACATPTSTASPSAFRKEKLTTGDDPHLPESIGSSRCDSTLVGTYRLCLARDGRVQSVDVLAGIPDADDSIVATLRGWRYRPLPLPLCFEQNLAFRVECRGRGRPAVESDAATAVVDVQESWFVAQKLSQDDEPSPPAELKGRACGERVHGRYRLCIGGSGLVRSVTALDPSFDASGQIAATLKSWRFRPQPTALCVEKTIEFVAPCVSASDARGS